MNNQKFLQIGSVIFKVLAWISVAVGTISALIIFIGGGTLEAPRAAGFIGLLLGLVYFFIFFIASSVITIILEIREKVDKGA